jgi:DNA-binding SARP family transcriptional activator
MDIPTFTMRYFEELYRTILECGIRNAKSSAIIFDNYQDIPIHAPLHQVLNIGLSLLPKEITAMVISRNDPHAEFARLRANRKLSYIGWNKIRFTINETREMLRRSGFRSLPRNAIRRLHEVTQGWIAGLVLLAERIEADDSVAPTPEKITREEIFDYFATEVFRKADTEVQTFLLKTAFLPQLTPGMAKELTGIQRAEEILFGMDRSHFFITSHSGKERTYQYHSLFREFLQYRAKKVLGRDEVREIQLNAGSILVKTGHFEDAALLLIDSENWEGLSDLILSQARSFISEGRNISLQEWIRSLPEKIMGANPWLLYWLGVCGLPFNLEESRSNFENSFRIFNENGDRTGALLSWSGAVDTIFYERGDFSRMDPWIQWLDNTMGDVLSFPSLEVEVAVVSAAIGAITFWIPGYHRRSFWLARAEAIVDSDITLNSRIDVASILYLYYIYAGSHKAFSNMLNILKPTIDSATLPPLIRIKWHLMEAIYGHMVSASGEDCLASVMKGLDLSRKTGMRVLDTLLLTIGAYGSVTWEKFDEMDRIVAKLNPVTGSFGSFDKGNFYCCLLNRDLFREDIPTALEHGRKMIEAFEKSKAPFPLYLGHVGLGQALFEEGKLRKAAEQFSRARQYIRGIGDFDWEVILLLPEAYVAFKTGNRLKGVALLRKAMRLCANQGYLNTLYWRPKIMAFLCLRALEEGIEVDYVKKLICARNLLPPHLPSRREKEWVGVENWPFPLKIYTLGRFNIVVRGQSMTFTGKVQQKPLAMLKAVITLGKATASRDQLIDALWPEAEGDRAYQSFRFTLHQLRRIIGVEDAIRTGDEHVMLDRSRVWVDVWALQEIMDYATGIATDMRRRPKDHEDALRDLADKAISLYQGDFLPGDSKYSWILPMRERLKGSIVRLIGIVGERLENASQWDKAIEYYQKAIEVNELQEEFYRRLMRCYHRLGRRAEAATAYQRCRTLLTTSLDIEPSVETVSLFRQIVSSQ